MCSKTLFFIVDIFCNILILLKRIKKDCIKNFTSRQKECKGTLKFEENLILVDGLLLHRYNFKKKTSFMYNAIPNW